MKKIRVMIVEDSGVIRQFLEHIIRSDPRLEVVASVDSAERALQCMSRVMPDVVSMDIHLPGMSGLEATRRIMEDAPTPIVVVSGSRDSGELRGSMNALKSGALAVVEKPVGTTHNDYEAMAERLCTQLAIMSQVRVVRQRFNGKRLRPHVVSEKHLERICPRAASAVQAPQMIGIVASTGGPKALQTLLSALPGDFPLPIALVQHITASFHHGFVEWLDQACSLAVETAKDGQQAVPGHVYVAPADLHMEVAGARLYLRQSEPVSAQRPSGTVLLKSMAHSLKHEALGVLLTGMGDDGAAGLHSIHNAGGHTIAEDESTAVVFGMPRVAADLGAVCEQLPLWEIGPRLVEIARQTQEVAPWAARTES